MCYDEMLELDKLAKMLDQLELHGSAAAWCGTCWHQDCELRAAFCGSLQGIAGALRRLVSREEDRRRKLAAIVSR